LASVIASPRVVKRPRDLEGRTVGVTGLPSDDAVLDSVVSADGGDPQQVHRVTIGFNAVASLAAGRVDAATAFWNAEGVTLKRRGVPIRIFRVDDYGAPRYPELVLVTTGTTLNDDPDLVHDVVDATARGYSVATSDPGEGLDDLLAADPSLDRADQAAELRALESADAFRDPGTFDWPVLKRWAQWEAQHGIVRRPPAVSGTFAQVK
jgi:NitT/TauT family transport system substrate-binding protein/putative hydroxymethylpyrimidine transport system substrate-binding protein